MLLSSHTPSLRSSSAPRGAATFLFMLLFLSSAATPVSAQTFLGCENGDGEDGMNFNLVTTNPAQAGDAVVYFAAAREGNQDDNTTIISDLENDFEFPNASIDEIQVHGGIESGGQLFSTQGYYIDFNAAAIPSGTSIPFVENAAGMLDFSVCAVAISNVDQVAVADLTADTGTGGAFTLSTATVSVQSGDVLLAGFAENGNRAVASSSGSGSASGLTLYTLGSSNATGALAGGTASTTGNASYSVTYATSGFASGSILAFRGAANSDPVFANGASTALTVDEDDPATSLSALLEVDDTDTGQTLTWSVVSGPSNGTLAGFPATVSSGTGVQPSGVTYEPSAGFVGSDSFEIQVDDGNGGTDNITVNVTVNNITPVLSPSNSVTDYTEGGTSATLFPNITINDSGTEMFASGTVTASDPRAGDVLAATNVGGFSATYDAATFTLTLTGPGTQADLQAALRSVNYSSTSDDPTAGGTDGSRTFNFQVTEEGTGVQSNTVPVQVLITAVNDAPTLTLGASSGSINENNAAPNVLTSITINDPDGGTNTLSLTGAEASAFQINGTDLEFAATADFETQSSYSVTVNVDDTSVGATPDDSSTFLLSINDVNEAPTASGVPTDVTVTEDTASNFDLSAVTFADAEGDLLTVTLVSTAGTFSASSSGGVTVGGSAGATLTLSGTPGDINTYLDTASNIQYTGAPDASGNDAASFTLNVNDGTVNPQLGSGNIDIAAVNDPPVIGNLNGDTTGFAAGTTANIDNGEDATVNNVDSDDYDGGALSIADNSNNNTANGDFSVDGFSVTSGGDGAIAAGETIAVGGVPIGTVSSIDDGQGGNSLQIDLNDSATNARLQTLLRNIRWSAAAGSGAQTFTLTLNDADGTANGGDQDTTANFSMVLGDLPGIITITSASGDGLYGVGGTVNVTVSFDEAVDFTANGGTLQATLSNGEAVTLASADAAGQTSFSGAYTINEGETDSSDLNVGNVSLTGSATLVASDDGLPADLALPAGQNLADNQDIVVDANTPAAPQPDLTAATDTGSSDSDNLTNIAAATVTGSTEAGASVQVRVGGASVGTANADGGGNWSFTFAGGDLSEGANAIDIVASDGVNTSAESPDLTVTLDTAAPTLSGVDLVPASDTGTSNADNITSDATPTIEFTAENGATVEVDWANGSGFVAVSAGTGSAQQETLGSAYASDGAKSISARATDAAGNAATTSIAITVDTTPPSLNAFARQAPADQATNADSLTFRATFSEDVFGVDTANFAASGTSATVTGAATVTSDTVFDLTVSGGDLADLDGTVGIDLAAGQNIADIAGNALPTSEPATDETYSVDNTAPTVAVDSLTTTDSTPSLSGTVDDDDATLGLTVDGQTVTPTNNGDGTWTLADDTLLALANGTYDVTVTATDPAGNEDSDATIDELMITPDTDGDGVNDSVENAGPNGGDANDDGTPDADQSSVTTLQTATGRGYMTLEVRGACGQLQEVAAVALESLPDDPAGNSYPFGLVEFRLPCETALVDVTYHDADRLDFLTSTYRKYGPVTPGDASTAEWYDFSDYATLNQTTWTLDLADDRLGDDSGNDGVIVDQGGPSAASALPIPADQPWALWLLIGASLLLARSALRATGAKTVE